MDHWSSEIASGGGLSAGAVEDLRDIGFIVMPGPPAPEGLEKMAESYDRVMASAAPADISIGSSTTRVHDFVNRGPDFDDLYIYRPILDACCRVIGQPFKLSSMLGRTLRPFTPAQGLHVDFERDTDGWPMVGFILMVDEFRRDNGATRFVPGSHKVSTVPDGLRKDQAEDYEGQVLACGPAGSVIVYNGSVWHGHTANSAGEPRRSIQGAYVRREAQPGVILPPRMRPETLARISPLAKYVLSV
jgi:hypothetical protein